MKSPSLSKLEKNEVHVWRIALDGSYWDCAHPGSLSLDERERASKMLHAESRLRFERSRLATREILARYLRLNASEINFRFQEAGKPEVEGVKFSISHSGKRALCAVALSEVGVDVEFIRDLPRLDDLVQRFLTADEKAQIGDAENRLDRFFKVWTRKEACLKALGFGLSGHEKLIEGLHTFTLDVDSGYRGALATTLADVKIIYRDFNHNG